MTAGAPVSGNIEGAVMRPFDAIMLDVGDRHWLYVERCGNPAGSPALFLHGGPGSGSQHMHRALFDPGRHHAILFDQRGAGRSHPYLVTRANTTQHLIADIERIRTFLGIDRWLVVGGSWGSTLALAYAEAHPARVSGLVLRSVFLGTRAEIEWAFIEGPKRFRPELYAEFVSLLPEAERADPLAAYVARLTSGDPERYRPAAHVWNAYERALSELKPASVALPANVPRVARLPPTPVMEAHYIAHDFFLAPDQLVREAARLSAIPGVIVQGRYDLLCPPAAAHAIHKAWGPASRLHFAETAGHVMTEPGITEAMRAAIAELTLVPS